MPEEVKDPITNLKLGNTDSEQYWLNIPYLAPPVKTDGSSPWTVESSQLPDTLATGIQIILKLPANLGPGITLTVNETSGIITSKGGLAIASFKAGSLLHLYFDGTTWIILN